MTTQAARTGGGNRWRVLGWGSAAFLLLLPLLAMQVTNEVNWDETDFLVFGVMLAIAGGVIELAARAGSGLFRAAAAVAVLAAFLLVWVNLAVGLFGSEDNPANLMFFGVILFALAGALLVRMRASGMAQVMAATAGVQALVGVAGLVFDLTSPGARGVYEVVVATTLFGSLWLFSAWLFHRAAKSDQSGSRAG